MGRAMFGTALMFGIILPACGAAPDPGPPVEQSTQATTTYVCNEKKPNCNGWPPMCTADGWTCPQGGDDPGGCGGCKPGQ